MLETAKSTGLDFSDEGSAAFRAVWGPACSRYAEGESWEQSLSFETQWFTPKIERIAGAIALAAEIDGQAKAGEEHVFRGMVSLPMSFWTWKCPTQAEIHEIAPEMAVAV